MSDSARLFDELHDLIHAQIEGRLTQAQTHRLDQLVRESDEACNLYVNYVEETVALKWWAERVPETSERALAQQILMEAVEEDMKARAARELIKAAEEEAERKVERERRQSLRLISGYTEPVKPVRHYVIPTWAAYGTVAAIATIIIAVLYPMFTEKPQPEPRPEQTVAVQPPPVAVATLEQIKGARWSSASEQPELNEDLFPGKQTLNSGIAYIRLKDGALVAIEGPATFDLQTSAQMQLIDGRLAAVVPKRAVGFTVFTPTAKVVDYGTEFGVDVDDDSTTEVHVFLGRVKAGAADIEDDSSELTELRASQAGRVDANSKILRRVEMNVDDYVTALPHLALLNRNLVVNGGFEDGPYAVKRDTPEGKFNSALTNEDIPGWHDGEEDSLATVISYKVGGLQGFPSGDKGDWLPYDNEKGEQFFVGRTQGVTWQEVDLRPLSSHIDRELVNMKTSAWLGGLRNQNDRVEVNFRYLDENKNEIEILRIDAVTAADRDNESGFMKRYAKGTVPLGTRWIRVELMTYEDTWIADGYADDIRMELSLRD